MATKTLAAAAVLALATLWGAGAQAGNLLANGSFENTTNFVPDGNDTMSLFNPSTAMTGWTVVGDSIAWIGPRNPFGLTASDGSYFLDLTDYPVGPPFGGVEQTINTQSGATYTLSFDLGSDPQYGLPDGLTATAGLTSQTFTSASEQSNHWTHETMTFTGTGSPMTIELLGNSGNAYIGLDNVSVTVGGVPEPATWTMLLLGVGLVGGGLRIARRQGAVALTTA